MLKLYSLDAYISLKKMYHVCTRYTCKKVVSRVKVSKSVTQLNVLIDSI